ncbi:unnamed protein product [Parascedosporium putredinis]|uniref:RING-type domain-containing protein n=1 Tax=Parascedosporium putredinis TaxID=1442378 RepID=A0A9P1H897_9PEZI|nr:unnamed protein product [Parascedosporium putredinis]CAI7999540.1 unnamed protein product [Parascedosporium putredinis]
MADDAKIRSQTEVPDWISNSAMTADDRGTILIEGHMMLVDASNYRQPSEGTFDEIAYVSCDEPSGGTDLTQDEIVNTIMATSPLAIVLYTLAGNVCALEGDNLPYDSIFTLIDSGDAEQALSFLNATTEDSPVHVSISGNTTQETPDSESSQNGSNSAVAMSVLYSITGLVTVLFLVIIATGTIRAHRYPERYGPRGGYEGRPRQSRAKGIARAPYPTNPKDTPNTPGTIPDCASEFYTYRHYSRPRDSCPDRNRHPKERGVLPCDHKFHPACVDPWLVNVSGTCPLCRLDLRPEGQKEDTARVDETQMPPPLELDETDDDTVSATQRSRASRFFDLSRLRHASAEERIQALRQFRHSQAPPLPPSPWPKMRKGLVASSLRTSCATSSASEPDLSHVKSKAELQLTRGALSLPTHSTGC